MSRHPLPPSRCRRPQRPATAGPRAVCAGLGLALGLAGAVTASAAPFQFTSRYTIVPIGAAPQGLAVGDLNGDGHADFVCTNTGANPAVRDSVLHVTLGDGAGGFRPGGDFAVGALPGGVALADLDGDGKLDAVVTSAATGTLDVLQGKGDGTFDGRQRLRVGLRPIEVLARDLDGDGRVDLCAVNIGTGVPPPGELQAAASGSEWSDSSGVTLYLTKPRSKAAGAATGARAAIPAPDAKGGGPTWLDFQPRLDLGGGAQNFAVDAGDMDGDGRLDLVVAQRTAQTIRFWNARPDGGFVRGRDIVIGAEPTDVALADVDRDGALDVVALAAQKNSVEAHDPRPEERAALVVLCAARQFAVQSAPFEKLAPYRLQLADVDEDGNLDVVGIGRGFLCVQRGKGDGTFADPTTLRLDAGGAFALARLNGDEHLDVVCGSSRGQALLLAAGNGDGTFGNAVDFPTGANPADVLAVDVTGDGRLDLVSADAGQATISVLAGLPARDFAPAQSFAASEGVVMLASGDLDGDRDVDLVTMAVRGRASTIDIYRNDGHGDFAPRATLATGLDPAAIVVADINRDRKLDLLVTRVSQPELLIFLGRGGAEFRAPQRVPVPQPGGLCAVADLDGDGNLDLVSASARQSTITVLLGKGDATFVAAPSFRTKYEIGSLAVADLNRDGKPDLVLGPRSAAATGAVLAGTGNGTFGQRSDFQVGLGCNGVVLADLDADGALDLVASDAAAGGVTVLRGGPQGLGERADFGTGPAASACAAADFDGDGKLEIVVANRESSMLTLLHQRDR